MRRFGMGALTLFVAAPVLANTTFSDGTFKDPDWTSYTMFDTTPGSAAVATYSQMLTGGAPDEYRSVTHTWEITGPGVSIGFGNLRNGAGWNPSTQGAISSINYTFSAATFSAPYVNAIAYGIAIRQGGVWYTGGGVGVLADGQWHDFAGTLTQSSFVDATGTFNPDFSAGGAALEFGFYTGNGGSGISFIDTATGGVDNWSVEIVPAPGVATLLAGTLGLARRRR